MLCRRVPLGDRHTRLLAVWLGRPFPGCSTANLALVKAKRHQDALGSPGVGLCPVLSWRTLGLLGIAWSSHCVHAINCLGSTKILFQWPKHYSRLRPGKAVGRRMVLGEGIRALVLTHPGYLEGLPARQGPPLCSCSAAHIASCHSCVTW